VLKNQFAPNLVMGNWLMKANLENCCENSCVYVVVSGCSCMYWSVMTLQRDS